MPDYLTLRHAIACPRCFCKQITHFRQCPNCGTMLFTRRIQFSAFEEGEGVRNWWCYDPIKGWVHRDHYMIPEAKPNEREYKVPKLPDDYGKHTTPEEVQKKGGKLNLKGKIKPPRRFY